MCAPKMRTGSLGGGRVSAPCGGGLSVRDDLAGRVLAGLAGDAAARMGARARQVEPLERQPVAGVAEERPPQEELVERRLAVQRVAAGQAVVALEIERASGPRARRTERAEPGRERLERRDDARRRAPRAPASSQRPVAQRVRRVLDDDAHDVACPAGAPSTSDGSTSDGIVASRTGASRDPAVLRRHRRPARSRRCPGATRIRPRSSASSSPPAAGEPRQPVEDEVDLGDRRPASG